MVLGQEDPEEFYSPEIIRLNLNQVLSCKKFSSMRQFARLLIFISCFSCSDNSKNDKINPGIDQKDPKLVLYAVLKASYSNYINKNDRNYYYLVELRLINNSRSEIQFYTLTCSSLVNIITDSNDVSFLYHNCTTNIAVLVTLKPNQEYSLPVILIRNKYFKWYNPEIRFGFLLNKTKSGPFAKNQKLTNQEIISELNSLREKQENVIWSLPVALTATNYSPYEIREIKQYPKTTIK
jgi:hypothetical protein